MTLKLRYKVVTVEIFNHGWDLRQINVYSPQVLQFEKLVNDSDALVTKTRTASKSDLQIPHFHRCNRSTAELT